MKRRILIAVTLSILALVGASYFSRSTARRGVDWQFAYDAEGRVAKLIDPGGKTTRIAYESDEHKRVRRISKRVTGEREVSVTYDRFGRRTGMKDEAGAVNYAYDDFGRLTAVQREGQPAVHYEHDTLGRVSAMEIAEQKLAWRYDFLGRVAGIETPAGAISYEYRETQMVRAFPNGARSVYEWNADGSLKSITHTGTGNRIIKQFSYGYRPDGLISLIRELSTAGERRQNFEYDQAQRLSKVTDTRDGETVFHYDAVGNLIETVSPQSKSSSAYDWAGRMTAHDGQAVTHDGAGNLTSYVRDGRKLSFGYTGANQLREASVGGSRVRYDFDGDGNIFRRTSGGERTIFLPAPGSEVWQPLMAIDQATGKRTLYVWEGDTPVAAIVDGQAEFFLNDHLGSAVAVMNQAGALAREFDYSSFGEPNPRSANYEIQPGFAGMFYDSGAALYLTRNRGFDPGLGRFLHQDPEHRLPLGSQKDISSYVYCGNDPVNYVDRNGAQPRRSDAQPKSDTQPSQPPPFLGPINGVYAHFEDAVALGLGSGVRSHRDILNEVQGRFRLVDITASGKGGPGADLRNYVFTGGRDETGRSPLTSWSADHVVAHSAGNHLHFAGDPQIIRVDPSSQNALPHSSISKQGIVSDLTSLELQVRKDYVGVGVRARFGSNPIEGVVEAAKDVASFVRGGATFVARGASGTNPFKPHLFENYRDALASEGKIQPSGKYDDHVQIVDRDGTYHYTKDPNTGQWIYKGTTAHPTSPSLGFPTGSSSAAVTDGRGKDGSPGQSDPKSLQNPVPSGRPDSYGVSQSSGTFRTGGGSSSGSGGERPIGICGTPFIDGGPHTPSNVGGIWLAGIGEAMRNLTGAIKGVAFDQNTGRLVLISEEQGQMNLPPLRIEDIATIFRSVYQYGESPWVTIDPDPAQPNGKTMLVRGGQATEDSYVHWVLYECDRHMKSLNLQTDSLTQQRITTKVPGYKGALDFGAAGKTGWERFWILPASVQRKQSGKSDLTLLDVPLKVETEPMEMRGGKLVSARNRKPSAAAEYFSKWFTEHFDEIAKEHYATPPAGSGIQTPVPVFDELRRIALVAAVAENMRDQNVPLPQWIRDFPTPKVSVDKRTPAITLREKNGNIMRRIYGGATLSPADDVVRTIAPDAEAESLSPAVWRAVNAAPLLKPVSFEQSGKRYKALALPGNETRDLAPARLIETDLVVPVRPGGEIRLDRSFNSFFKPAGEFGGAWSFDFPRLEKLRRPTKRTQNEVQFSVGYQLTSPLLSYAATFAKQQFVAEANGTLIAPDKPGEWLGVGTADEAMIGARTNVVYFRDGRRWHFTEDGNLAAVIEAPYAVVYRWSNNRLQRIEGWHGKQLHAEIRLAYDEQTRLRSATASNGPRSDYSYDAGVLRRVRRFDGAAEYDYDNGLVTAVRQNGALLRQFEYSNRLGQLSKERWGDGRESAYSLSGGRITIKRTGSADEAVQYDEALRPVSQVLADGSRIEWKHSGGDAEAALTTAAGEQYLYSRNADASRQSWRLPEGGTYRSVREGRMVALFQGEREVARRYERADGQLEKTVYETFEVYPSYGEDGAMVGVMITERIRDSRFGRWLKADFDQAGRTIGFSDYTGVVAAVSYDQAGVAALRSTTSGWQISRDAEGRTQTVQASAGGQQHYAYDPATGLLRLAEVIRGNDQATIEFEDGRPRKIRSFDGGEIEISYFGDEANKGQVERIRTASNLIFTYQYTGVRISSVTCNAGFKFRYSFDANGRIVGFSQLPAGP